jgi:uncharacterized protein (DUF39 family)
VSPELIFSIAVIIGVLIRTILPFLKKKIDDPTTKFARARAQTLFTQSWTYACFMEQDRVEYKTAECNGTRHC